MGRASFKGQAQLGHGHLSASKSIRAAHAELEKTDP